MAVDIIARGMAANAGSGGSSEIDSRFGDSETYPIGGVLDKTVWVKVGEFDFVGYNQVVLYIEDDFYNNSYNLLGLITLSKSDDNIECTYMPITRSLKTGENNFRTRYYNNICTLYAMSPANDKIHIKIENNPTVKLFHENDVYNSASQLPTPLKQGTTLYLPLNSLTGTSLYRPLSAKQGKVLNDKITALQNTITALCEANGLTIPETVTAQVMSLTSEIENETETEEGTDDEI